MKFGRFTSTPMVSSSSALYDRGHGHSGFLFFEHCYEPNFHFIRAAGNRNDRYVVGRLDNVKKKKK